MKKRVVVTGMGIVSPLGCEVETAYQNAVEGYNGVGEITYFDTSKFAVKIGAQVKDFDPEKRLSKKDIRRQDAFSQYAVYSALEAWEDAGLKEGDFTPEETGVIIASGIGGIQTMAHDLRVLDESGPDRMPPMFIPKLIVNIGAGNVAIALNAKGHCESLSTACAAGTNAIGDAYRWIASGDAEIMVAGGSEAGITECCLAGFHAIKALSTTNDPETASRPFDKNRDGFVIGEGAGVLILEEYEHAKKRGAKMYAEIVGYGSACDAFHMTAPSGEGLRNAMNKALKMADVAPSDIDYLNAHGTSTSLNDEYETKAIKEVFGAAAYDVSISSTKSMHGHALGGTGCIEAILTIKAMENSLIPPTIHYETPDEECDLDFTPNVAKKRDITYAMSDNLGFGGHNAVLIFKKV